MRELLKKYLKVFLLLPAIMSCSLSSPVIKEVKWDIKLSKDIEKNVIYESLSLFINISDDDGKDDIKTILIIDDKSQIHWELNSDNWIKRDQGEVWYGSNSIIMPDRSPIPRTTYKLFIRDRAGEYTEDKLYITKQKIDVSGIVFPELKIEDDIYTVNRYDDASILAFSSIGEQLYSGLVPKGGASFQDIFLVEPRSIEDLNFYIIVKEGDQVLESGPWK